MQLPGDMNVQGLALLGGGPEAGDQGAVLTARMFDTDGDGQNDLFLVDADGDGTVDGAIRALDSDHDGINDTFVQYDEDGEVQAVGRLDPASREFEVVTEDSDEFDDLVASLGLAEAAAPDDALFTTFDDPYFIESFGSTGEDVPDALEDGGAYADASVTEVDESDLGSLDAGAAIDPGDNAPGQPDAASGPDEPEPAPLEVTPRVVEVEDWSGAGDGSDLHAKIDQDGDGLAEDDERLFRTSDGTWHGDVNRDGYSEEVAFDRDQDGRIDSVDLTGQGSSIDQVGAEQVVAPESDSIIDRHPGEDDTQADASQAAASSESADSEGGYSAQDTDAGTVDDAGSSYDSGSSCDSGSGGSSSSSDSDIGSTTIDSGSDDPGGTESDGS